MHKKTKNIIKSIHTIVFLFVLLCLPSGVFGAAVQNFNPTGDQSPALIGNVEVGEVVWVNNVLQVRTRANGSGSIRPLTLTTGSNAGLVINTNGTIVLNGVQMSGDATTRILNNIVKYTESGEALAGAIVIQTTIPQDASVMFNIDIDLFGRYQDANSIIKITTGGYLTPESNGGFRGWFTNTSSAKPRLRYMRNVSTGNTAIVIGDITSTWNYPKMAVSRLLGGYNWSDTYAAGWTVLRTADLSGYTNSDDISEITTAVNSTGALTGSISASQVSGGAVFGSTAGKGNYTFQAAANTNSVLFVDAANERVGVGTNSPSTTFDVRNGHLYVGSETFSNPGSWASTINLDGSSHARILIEERSTGVQTALWSHTGGNAKVGTVSSHNFGIITAGTERVTIDTSGDVGIGTTSPGSWRLNVEGGNEYGARVSTNGTQPYIFQILNRANTLNTSYGWWLGQRANGNLFIHHDGQGDRLSIDNSGNVGIGNSAPSYKLDVSGSMRVASGDNSYTYYGPNSTWGGMLYVGASPQRSGANTASIISSDGNLHLDNGTSKTMYLNYYTAGNIIMASAGGSVGIGVSPGSKLDVNGDANIRGPLYTDGSVTNYMTHGTYVRQFLQAARNSGGTGDASLYTWISEPGQTWTGAGIARNMYNTTGWPRVNTGLSGQMMRFTEGNDISFIIESSGGTRYTPLTLSGNNATVTGSVTATGGFSGPMTGALGAAYITPGSFGSTSGKGNYVFEAAANTNNVLKVDAANERVGVGTASPTQKLDVSGDILAVNHRVVAANGNGLCFWSDCTNYKVHMGVGTEYQYGPVTDYSIKTTMDAGAGRGFTWGRSGIAPIAAMNAYTGNFQTAGTMTATQFIGGGASITGVNADTLDTFHASALQFSQSNRDFVNGTLIQSNIDYSQTSGEPFLLEIEGNSYGSLIPFDIKVQGYIYSDTIINAAGIANGTSLSGLVAFNYNGKLCFWFPRQAYWQGFSVFINDSYSGVKENRLVSISDSIKPAGITKEYTFTIYQGIHSGNLGSQTINATKVTPGLFGGGNFGFDTNTLYIDATNHRVGVGTATPGYPLQVGGSTNRSTPSLVVGDYGTINMIPYSTTHTYASLYTGNAEDLRMTAGTDNSQLVLKANNGNVGVGTASPGYKFVVNQAASDGVDVGYGGVNANVRMNMAIGVPGTKALYIGADTSENMIAFGNHAASSGYKWISHNGSAWVESMRIHTNGNIGIGVTNPGTKLVVLQEGNYSYPNPGPTARGAINLRASTSGYSTGITFSSASADDAQAGIYVSNNSSDGTRMYFATTESYATGPQTRMMIGNTGNVGIASTTPAYKLAVIGTGYFSNPVVVGSPVDANHATTKSYVDSVLGTGGSGTSTASFGTIYVSGTSTLAATGGKVIIGGAGPSLKLDVTGQGQLTDTISATKYYDYNDPTYYVDPANTGTALKFNGAMQAEGTGVNYLMGQLGVGASNPGTHRFYVGNGTSYFNNSVSINGTLSMVASSSIAMGFGAIGAVGKLTVQTIDPLYEIDGEKYSTFASSIAGGVKEEFVGRGKLISNDEFRMTNEKEFKIQNSKLDNYTYVIDFSKIEKGSDLWVWYQAVDFDKKNVEALVTAYGSLAKIGYKIDGKKLIFFGDEETEFSFRLVGNRHDWKEWPTYSKDQKETPSFILKAK